MSAQDRARTDPGFRFEFEAAPELECCFLTPDAVRLTWGPGPDKPSPSVVSELGGNPEVAWRQTADGWRIQSHELSLDVCRSGRLDVRTEAGWLLRRDDPPVRGEKAWRLRSWLQPEERLHGLGLRAAGLNLRPGFYRQWNRDPGGSYGFGHDPLYLCLPVLLGRHRAGSYLLFFDNTFESTVSLSRRPYLAEFTFADGPLRYYLLAGPPARALSRYAQLTGKPPLPPRWALGFHQSRWGYRGQGQVRRVAHGFRKHGLPLAAVHLDIDHMRGYRTMTVNKRRFPDLAGLARELGQRDVRLVSIVDPGVKRDPRFWLYRQGRRQTMFCLNPDGSEHRARVWPGWCVFPDFTEQRVRRWWGSQYRELVQHGIAGVWHDMNEPATFEEDTGHTLPHSTRHGFDGYGGDHREGHNLYGLSMAKAAYEGLLEMQPDRRPWILSRSGWAGLQRYAWSWTGDVESSWEALQMTLPSILNLGLSGMPFSGPDIGGFSGSPSRELFLRWFQLAAFLPFFRSHSAWDTEPREPWRFGKQALDILRSFLELRERLVPLLYTLCWQASQTGHPLVRPLFWDFPDEPLVSDVQDAFLLGTCLLVAPVLEASARRRQVPLPSAGWYHFWDDRRLGGGRRASLPAPLERIPVLVRAGSVLPLAHKGSLILHIYPPEGHGSDDGFPMYSDAGDGFADWRLDRFRLRLSGSRLELAWSSQGSYPWPYQEVVIQLHGAGLRTVRLDGRQASHDGARVRAGRFSRAELELDW